MTLDSLAALHALPTDAMENTELTDRRLAVLQAAALELTAMGRPRLAAHILREAHLPPLSGLISELLKRTRKQLGITQKEAASRATLPLATYLSAEYGLHSPSLATIKKLERLANLTGLIKGNPDLDQHDALVNSRVA